MIGATVVAALRRLPWGARAELLHLGVVALAVEVGLRTRPLPRLARALGVEVATGAGAPAPQGAVPATLTTRRRVRQLDAAARLMRHWPVERICLRRALLLGYVLRDLSPQLRLGVAREGEHLIAHAWIEVAGVRLDPDEDRFVALGRPSPHAHRGAPI